MTFDGSGKTSAALSGFAAGSAGFFDLAAFDFVAAEAFTRFRHFSREVALFIALQEAVVVGLGFAMGVGVGLA